jgi:hypothetical protein
MSREGLYYRESEYKSAYDVYGYYNLFKTILDDTTDYGDLTLMAIALKNRRIIKSVFDKASIFSLSISGYYLSPLDANSIRFILNRRHKQYVSTDFSPLTSVIISGDSSVLELLISNYDISKDELRTLIKLAISNKRYKMAKYLITKK